jgi:uncharacterized protein (TIGR02597 family)
MKIKASAIAAAALLALTAQTVSAAETVGYNVVTVPANSDAVVSVPFSQNVEATFTVDSVTGTGITVNESLSAGTYSSSYYIRFIDGDGEGLWSTITDNGDGGLTLSDDLSAYVATGDTFQIHEHQTLGSVFASGLYGVTFTNSTQLLVPNTSLEAINKAATAYSYQEEGLFGNPAGWYNGFTYASSTVIPPESFVIVRNQSESSIEAVTFGGVPSTPLSAVFDETGSSDDLYLGVFPVDVQLKDLGLEGLGQLLVVDNSASGFNKAGKAYTYQSSGILGNSPGWYDGFTYAGDTVLEAGTGIIFRRSSGASEAKWTMAKPF